MIIYDFSNIVVGAVMDYFNKTGMQPDLPLMRHIALNTIITDKEKKSGTSEYWSMYNQYFCHTDWAGGFKAPWNLEPARPNVGYLKTVNALCNPS